MKWTLKVYELAASSLLDLGSKRDPQDPCLTIKVGELKVGETARAKDAGTSATYTEVFECKIDADMYEHESLTILVDNKSLFGSKTSIGKGEIAFKNFIELNSACAGEIILQNPKAPNGVAGTVTFIAEIITPKDEIVPERPAVVVDDDAPVATEVALETNAAPAPSAVVKPQASLSTDRLKTLQEAKRLEKEDIARAEDKRIQEDSANHEKDRALAASIKPDENKWELTIDHIFAKELVSTGSKLDEQDPTMKIWLGDTLVGKTERLKDAGVDASFKEVFTLPLAELSYRDTSSLPLKVEVYNESYNGKLKHVGLGVISLKDVVPLARVNAHTEIKIPLQHESGKDENIDKGFVTLRVKVTASNMPVPDSKSLVEEEIRHEEGGAFDVPDGSALGGGDEGGKTGKRIGSNNNKRADIDKRTDVPFNSGKLHILNAKISDVEKGKEYSLDFELQHSKQDHQTSWSTKLHEGTVNMELFDVGMAVDRYHIHEGIMTIKAYHHNKWNPTSPTKQFDGECDIPLDILLLHIDNEVNLHADLVNEKGEKHGRISIEFKLEQWNDINEKNAVESGLDNGILEVKSMKFADMGHVDSTISSKVNHPFVKFHFNNSAVHETGHDIKPKDNASVFYDHLNYEFVGLTTEILKTSTMTIELFDAGTIKTYSVGSCNVSLADVALNKDCMVHAVLKNNGIVAANASILVRVSDTLSEQEKRKHELANGSAANTEQLSKIQDKLKQKAVDAFTGGVFEIRSATASSLKNVEIGRLLGAKNDPYLAFTFDDWKDKTEPHLSEGSDAHWGNLHKIFAVSRSTLTESQFVVQAWDYNLTGDKLIGQVSCSLSDYILDFDDDEDTSTLATNHLFKIKMDLSNAKGTEVVGHVVLECLMKPTADEIRMLERDLDVTEGVEKGTLFISKVEACGLRRDNNGKKNSAIKHPYLCVDYCSNSGMNPVSADGIAIEKQPMLTSSVGSGPDASWLTFPFMQLVSKRELQTRPMVFHVKENDSADVHNTNINDDPVIAVGKVRNMLLAGSQVGENVEIVIDLFPPSADTSKPLEVTGTDLGQLVVTCKIEDSTGKVDVIKASPRIEGETADGEGEGEGESKKFTDGVLMINYVQTKGVSHNGKPLLAFQIEGDDSTKESLPVLKSINSGDMHWDYDSKIVLDASTIKNQSFEVTVYEHHIVGKNTTSCQGHTALDFFYKQSRMNVPVELTVQLHDSKGKSKGRVIFGCEMRSADGAGAEKKKLPDNYNDAGALIHFHKAQTHNLKNTEFIGKADPYLVIKDHEGHEIGRTFTLFDKGGSVLFDFLDIKSPSDSKSLYKEEDLANKTITIEAWDENTSPISDTLIGTGVLKLKCLIGPINEEVEFPAVHLTDSHSNQSGRVHLFAKLEEAPPEKEVEINFPSNFEKGRACIKRIAGFGIENKNLTAMLGNKADPYLEISVYDKSGASSAYYFDKTAPIMDSGSHAVWDMLDFEFDVTKDILTQGLISVTAKDKNVAGTADYTIGAGAVSLRRCAQSIQTTDEGDDIQEVGRMIELAVDLNMDTPGVVSKNGKSHGRLVFYIEIGKEQPAEDQIHAKPNFEYGIMNISKIRTFDLTNTESTVSKFFGAQQDPYVKLRFGDWNDQTHTKDNAGSDAIWDFLVMENNVYLENIAQNKLIVQVMEENSSRKDVLIGSGEVSIVRCVTEENCGKEVALKIKLLSENGKPAGRVEVYMKVVEPTLGGTVPDNFDLGILTVKRAILLGLEGNAYKSTVTMRLNDQSESSETADPENDDPQWNMNWKLSCDKKTAKGGSDLIVEVHNHFTMGGDKVFGTAKIQLYQAAIQENFTKDIQLSAVILDKNEKRVGRAVLVVNLVPDIVKSLPITDSLPPLFVTGTVIVSKMQLSGNNFAKKKLYARFEYGNWSECSGTQKAGNLIWSPEGGINAEVNKDLLKSDRLRVVVLEDARKVKELASGYVTAKMTAQLCSNLKRKIPVSVDLLDINDSSIVVGAAKLDLTLTDEDLSPDNDDGLPDTCVTYKSGNLEIKKVSAFDLCGGDLIGKQDPYIKLVIENLDGSGQNWQAQTNHQEGAGRSAVWDSIADISATLSADALRYKRLKVFALDKNNFTGDALMGSGDIGLKGVGSVQNTSKLLIVNLKDANGKAAGRVEINATVFPEVDMSTGVDMDGDGVDDGVEATKMQGVLEIKNLQWSRNKGSASDVLFATFHMGGWKAKTDCESGDKDDMTWTWRNLQMATKEISTAQLKREGLIVKFWTKATGISKEKCIGEKKMNASPALGSLGDWAILKGDVNVDGKFLGKSQLSTRFVPEDHSRIKEQREKAEELHIVKPKSTKVGNVSDDVPVGPGHGDQLLPSLLAEAQKNGESNAMEMKRLKEKVTNMEKSLKSQMQQLVATQTKDLKLQMEATMHSPVREKEKPKKEKWDIFNVTNVQLPSNVMEWRTAHVQAWLAFQVELPDYMETFLKASVDGLVLLKYMDEDCLLNTMNMSSKLHRAKIMDAIEQLKERQEVINKKADTMRRALLRKQAADEEAEAAREKKDEEKELKRLEKSQKKKTSKKSKSSSGGGGKSSSGKSKNKMSQSHPNGLFDQDTTGRKQNSEQNQIDRVKMDREIRKANEAKKLLAEKMMKSSKTWKFEYTGSPMPRLEDELWGDNTVKDGEHPELGTKEYQRTMEALDVLNVNGAQQGKIRPKQKQRIGAIKTVNPKASVDEVIAEVKNGMFNLSSRLLAIQTYQARKDEGADDDLESCGFSILDAPENDEYLDLDLGESASNKALADMGLGEHKGGDESTAPGGDGEDDWAVPPPATDDDDEYFKMTKAYIPQRDEAWTAPPSIDNMDSEEKEFIEEQKAFSTGDYSLSLKTPLLVPGAPPSTMSLPNSYQVPRSPIIRKKQKEHRSSKKDMNDCLHKDRMTLVYEALVSQTNNHAPFIGTNDKLTRLKLYGGFEALLRLKIGWTQFDFLWTRLDSERTGDLDLKEFKAFFGDLSEFEQGDGTKNLSMHTGNSSMRALTKVLFDMCDTIRHTGFTVEQMFTSFDRDGSGTITISEFCSLLRLIVGASFDKKLIYQALLVLDTDRNKNISREEFFQFIYKTWKTQLDEIDYRKSLLDDDRASDHEKLFKLNEERNLIKTAVKRNFHRQIRDALEESSHSLTGPFATMFNENDNKAASAFALQGNTTGERLSGSGSPLKNNSNSRASSPIGKRPSSPSMVARNEGEIMRFKIKPPGASSPTRIGQTLTLPIIHDMNQRSKSFTSAEATEALLMQSRPIGL